MFVVFLHLTYLCFEGVRLDQWWKWCFAVWGVALFPGQVGGEITVPLAGPTLLCLVFRGLDGMEDECLGRTGWWRFGRRHDGLVLCCEDSGVFSTWGSNRNGE